MFTRRLSLLLCATLLGVVTGPYGTRWDRHRFADCNAALLYASSHPVEGHFQYRISARLREARAVRLPSGGYRASGRIAYTFVHGDSAMVLPQWSWPRMTQTERERLAIFLSALRNHELGHWTIATRMLHGRQSTITVLDTSRAQVVRKLQRSMAGELHAVYGELLQAQNLYDRVTDHGVRQTDGPIYGFSDGPDVVFSCR
ncbi:MAG: hypothetical protein NVS1B14_07900 [Vulcanimicrobiaceae bacterium]